MLLFPTPGNTREGREKLQLWAGNSLVVKDSDLLQERCRRLSDLRREWCLQAGGTEINQTSKATVEVVSVAEAA